MDQNLQSITQLSLDTVEQAMLELPQVECEVQHHFGPGIYIREVTMPAGLLVMGHAHRNSCMNILVKGKLALMEDGEVRVVTAPMIFTTPPGRKLAYIIEDTVFQNIFPTDETDWEQLEDTLIDKSTAWERHQLDQATTMLLSAAGTSEG